MKKIGLSVVLMFTVAMIAAGCASSTGSTADKPATTPAILNTFQTENAPAIDGDASDQAWEKAKPVDIKLTPEQGAEPAGIEMRALYDEENVYILAEYTDSTPLKIGEAWAYDGTSWSKGAYDDTLAFVWNMDGSLEGFDEKGLSVMTTPLKNGLDVFDFSIDNPTEALLKAKLDFWGW